MTEHDQRIAIAKWMGWQCGRTKFTNEPAWIAPDGGVHNRYGDTVYSLPKYTRDLNVIAEAEKHLGDVNQLNAYADALDKVCVPTHVCSLTHWQAVVMATAAQRCEALLRTLNLWRDEPPAP